MRFFILLGGSNEEFQRRVFRVWEEMTMPTVAHEMALSKKYERAARFPWFPVAADPPAPALYRTLNLTRLSNAQLPSIGSPHVVENE